MNIFGFRLMTDLSPKKKYVPSQFATEHVLKGLHYGQRKLLLSEIEYLTWIYSNSPQRPLLIVYAGAAKGHHIPYLFKLFKGCRYILIDPASFCAELEFAPKGPEAQLLEICSGFCTRQLCERIAAEYGEKYEIHLVSDIRSGNPPDMTNWENTQMIIRDNEMQHDWIVSLGARSALLKFHPPYPSEGKDDPTKDEYEYLDGLILWGIWAPKHSTETRLLINRQSTESNVGKVTKTSTDLPKSIYNCKDFEERCFNYNNNNRYQSDVRAENIVLETYLSFIDTCSSNFHTDLKFGSAREMSKDISKELKAPEFYPLESEFTEDNARFYTLLYYSKREESIENIFNKWKDTASIATVINWCENREDAPLEISQRITWKSASEAYTLPKKRPKKGKRNYED